MNYSKMIGIIVLCTVTTLHTMETPQASQIMSTSLMQFAAVGKCKKLRALLKADKTLIDAQDSAGNTALVYATVFGQPSAVQLLVHEGASITLQNRDKVTVLEMSVLTNIPSITKMLLVDDLSLLKQTLGQALITDKNPERVYKNPLYDDHKKRKSIAIVKRNNRQIMECLQSKIDELIASTKLQALHPAKKSVTPLIQATFEGDEDKVQALLKGKEHLKTLNQQDCYGRTALHYAAILQKITIANHLINAGAQRNIQDQDTCTPLNHALVQNNIPMALLLLNAGVAIDQQVVTGHTPLNMAVTQNNPELVAAILSHNPDKSIACKNGLTPFKSAQALITLQTVGMNQALAAQSIEELRYAVEQLEKATRIKRMLCTPALPAQGPATPALVGPAIVDAEKIRLA